MGILFTEKELEYCLFLLKSYNNSLIKEALQYIFWEYEKGRELSKKAKKNITPLVNVLNNHDNVKVRRWFYIVISIIKPENIESKIKELLKGKENDNENLSWACASLFSCIGEENAWKFFKKNDTPLTSDQIKLSSLLFSKSTTKILSSKINLEKLLLNDDPLIPQWIILLYGYTNTSSANRNSYDIDKDIIRGLTQHPDRMVVEYAIWSLTYKNNTSYKDLGSPIDDLIEHPSNVRRWLYQLLGKDKESLRIFSPFLFEQIEREDSIDALDGLAKAITSRYSGKEYSKKIIKWYLHTDDLIIKIQLLKYFATFYSYEDDYIQILKEEAEEDPLLIQGIFGSVPSAENIFSDWNIYQHDRIKIVNNYFFINGEVAIDMSKKNINISNVNASGQAFNFGKIKSNDIVFKEIASNDFFKNDLGEELVDLIKKLENVSSKLDVSNNQREEITSLITSLKDELSNANTNSSTILTDYYNKLKLLFVSLSQNIPIATQAVELVEKIGGLLSKLL